MSNPKPQDLQHLTDDERATKIGETLARVLDLRKIRSGPEAGRYRMEGGTKTAAGLARTVARVMLEQW